MKRSQEVNMLYFVGKCQQDDTKDYVSGTGQKQVIHRRYFVATFSSSLFQLYNCRSANLTILKITDNISHKSTKTNNKTQRKVEKKSKKCAYIRVMLHPQKHWHLSEPPVLVTVTFWFGRRAQNILVTKMSLKSWCRILKW